MNTRSVTSSSDDSLSTTLYGGGSRAPASPICTRRGPNAPMCSQMDDDPGPPLNLNATGPLRQIAYIFFLVCDIDPAGLRLPILQLQQHLSCRRRVLAPLPADPRAVLALHRLFFRHRLLVFLRFLGGGLLRRLRLLRG